MPGRTRDETLSAALQDLAAAVNLYGNRPITTGDRITTLSARKAGSLRNYVETR
jgi:hypothetical protein